MKKDKTLQNIMKIYLSLKGSYDGFKNYFSLGKSEIEDFLVFHYLT